NSGMSDSSKMICFRPVMSTNFTCKFNFCSLLKFNKKESGEHRLLSVAPAFFPNRIPKRGGKHGYGLLRKWGHHLFPGCKFRRRGKDM
ncbi:MAG: hypothetical protein LBJ23_08080, partial [Tannerella sp.]|nr:hypothetical protein [Tannerella sp.]